MGTVRISRSKNYSMTDIHQVERTISGLISSMAKSRPIQTTEGYLLLGAHLNGPVVV